MKNNEEKMVIVEIKPNDGTACPLLDISNEMAPVCTLDNSVPYCKECQKGFSRAEAVKQIKSAFCKNCKVQDKSCFDCGVSKEGCEAALDALLEFK